MCRTSCFAAPFVLAALLGLQLPCPSRGQPAAKEDDAGKRFAALKDKLSKMAAKLDVNGMAGKLELARRTGPAEAKLTIVFSDKDDIVQASEIVHLRFHGGDWTTVSWDGTVYVGSAADTTVDDQNRKSQLRRVIPRFMREVDKVRPK